MARKKFRGFPKPSSFHRAPRTSSARLSDVARHYAPLGGGNEEMLATMAHVARNLVHPDTGVPQNFQGEADTNAGTPGTNVTAAEFGNPYEHVTVLTLNAVAMTPTVPANAEGVGAIIYTFPAGAYGIWAARMKITATGAGSATNNVDIGLGSVIATGDIATLTTATFEDTLTGQTMDLSPFVGVDKSLPPTGGAPLIFEEGGSHVLHLNAAGTFNAAITTLTFTGIVTIKWTFLGAA